MSIADKTFYRLWGETVDYLARKQNANTVPLHRRPTPDVIGTATRPRARGYLHEIEVAVQDPHSGEVSFHAWGVRTQKLISVGRILEMAVNSWAESQMQGRGTPEGRALGAMFLGTLHLIGEDDED